MRWPGIEPGSNAWKASMLTITPPTLRPIWQKDISIPSQTYFIFHKLNKLLETKQFELYLFCNTTRQVLYRYYNDCLFISQKAAHWRSRGLLVVQIGSNRCCWQKMWWIPETFRNVWDPSERTILGDCSRTLWFWTTSYSERLGYISKYSEKY